jgi:biopolymer transport protein ExbB
MVVAFDSIKKANDISPAIVAGGISQALLTTLFGLIVAMIIQVFNNYFTSRIDKLIIDMEESSVELIEALADLEGKN